MREAAALRLGRQAGRYEGSGAGVGAGAANQSGRREKAVAGERTRW